MGSLKKKALQTISLSVSNIIYVQQHGLKENIYECLMKLSKSVLLMCKKKDAILYE